MEKDDENPVGMGNGEKMFLNQDRLRSIKTETEHDKGKENWNQETRDRNEWVLIEFHRAVGLGWMRWPRIKNEKFKSKIMYM